MSVLYYLVEPLTHWPIGTGVEKSPNSLKVEGLLSVSSACFRMYHGIWPLLAYINSAIDFLIKKSSN